MNEQTPDTKSEKYGLSGTLKLVAILALSLSAVLLTLWVFDGVESENLLDLIGKTWLLAFIIASLSCVIAWLMRSK
ncbi:hypothetical protein [Methylococcus sp. EFPC2]|uniref:hypothetical protein n=1 Tax=Methylococcus sp. EFPC2 TaxID=2812648 RepID=UPI001966F403|nr:hypothetical protein [Methylococcus sp. EFPC2]QSA96926.1 hypothetical protein JWZ97_17245 [Methylococcus sp. EFPC2]